MKTDIWIKSAVVALLATTATAQPAVAPAAEPPLVVEQRRPLFPGGEYRKMVRGGAAPAIAHVVEVDLTRPNFRWAVTAADRRRGMEYVARTASDALRASGALMAINASYFLPFAGGSPASDDFYPQPGEPVSASGAVIADGRVVSPVETDLDIRINAVVCFRGAHGVIVDGQRCPRGTRNGVAAGPVLLAGGVRRPFLRYDNQYAQTRAPRSAIGFSADGKRAWVVAVDGRQAGVSVGMSLRELTDLFVVLGAADALNLDGGGSTTLVAMGARQPLVLNTPIHSGVAGRERPVANFIALFGDHGK